MRPASILWFERLYLGAQALAPLAAFGWRNEARSLAAFGATQTFQIVLAVALVWLIAHRRNKAALWALVILSGLRLINLPYWVATGQTSAWTLASSALILVQAIAAGLLFRESARLWFEGVDETNLPETTLKETFE